MNLKIKNDLLVGKQGFIRDTILIVIALIAIKYFFHVDVIGWAEIYIGKIIVWLKGKF